MFNFTIKRGVSLDDTVSVNYDDFIHDVEAGDVLLVDGKCRNMYMILNTYLNVLKTGILLANHISMSH